MAFALNHPLSSNIFFLLKNVTFCGILIYNTVKRRGDY
nr:MAG TPA: hypothetical protein [Caudoviricetes sp.]DAN46385.1 MAG TPA: hypothetical protein [Caudoviricetes sp.]